LEPEYVFIVGLPRTGTKLVKNVLESAPGVRCKLSPETFFLGHFVRSGHRRRVRALGDLTDDATIARIVDLYYSGTLHGTYWQQLQRGKLGVTREAFYQALLAAPRTERDVYRTMLAIHAPREGRVILGDKTPGNLYHVPTLLEWFPKAKVIHTVRDPRAVMASEWRRRMMAPDTPLARLTRPLYSIFIVVHMTVAGFRAVKLHHRYRRLYPESYYLSKFEDLVVHPEQSTRKLCDFLGIEFSPVMLNPDQVGSSYGRQGGTGFDREALTRWRSHLKPWIRAWLWFWGRKHLKEFGYTGP